ncbi:MAG: DUF87 domain-containing protein [Halobacteriales archaeon]
MPDVPERITVSDDGYDLPVESVLAGRGAIFGKSGSGKSNTVAVVAEELLAAGLPMLIVDQDGEYRGLADAFDAVKWYGADEACDRTVGVDDAGEVAERALLDNTPIVLDVSGFLEAETVDDLLYGVVRELFERENDVRKPFLIVIEEVHEYLPQQGGLDDLGEMLIRVAKRGRKRGLGVCGVSQRPAAVDKDFITQSDWLVWHRLTWHNDTAVVDRILGGDYADQVGDLEDGEAFVVADWTESVERVRFRMKRTPDGGATPSLDAYRSVEPDGAVAAPASDRSDGNTGMSGGGDVDATATDTKLFDGDDRVGTAHPDFADDGAAGGDAVSTSRSASPRDDEVPRGSLLWELGQLVSYLLLGVLRSLRRLLNPLLPGTRQPAPARLDIPDSERRRRHAAALLVVVVLVVGAVVALGMAVQ